MSLNYQSSYINIYLEEQYNKANLKKIVRKRGKREKKKLKTLLLKRHTEERQASCSKCCCSYLSQDQMGVSNMGCNLGMSCYMIKDMTQKFRSILSGLKLNENHQINNVCISGNKQIYKIIKELPVIYI